MTQTLQQFIVKQMEVKPEIDPAVEYRTRVDFLKNYLKGTGAKGFVLGISGGQDSALSGYLCQAAVRELRDETGDDSYKFLALLLPYGVQKDAHDAAVIAEDFIGADEIINFNIKESVDALQNEYNRHLSVGHVGFMPELKDFHKGNIKARIRMTTQYAYAGQWNLLVCSSDHSAENLVAYFTKSGDGAADIAPIFGLNKRQGRQLLRFLNVPEFVVTKAPTADLLDNAPQQTDESELAISYDCIDDFLEGKPIDPVIARKLEQRFFAMEHKRRVPVTMYDAWVKEYRELGEIAFSEV